MAFTKKIAGWVAGRIKGEKARRATMHWMEKTGLGMILDAAGDYALTQGALKGVGKLQGLLTGGGQAAQAGAAIPNLPAQAPMIETPVPASIRQMGAGVPAAAPKALPQGVTEVGRLASASPAESRAMAARSVQSAAPQPTFSATPRPSLPPAPSPMQAMVAPPATPPAIGGAAGGMTPKMTATAQRMGGVENVANANIAGGPGGFRGAAQFARENASWLGPAASATGKVVGSYIDRSVEEEKMKREQEAKNRMAQLLMPMFQYQLQQYDQQYNRPLTLPPLPGGR